MHQGTLRKPSISHGVCGGSLEALGALLGQDFTDTVFGRLWKHKSNLAACKKRTAIRNQMAVRFLRDIGGMIRWQR